MSFCHICPRDCGIDRERGRGFCGAGALPAIALSRLHPWEEPCISGTRGSGTVFFSGCNLDCVFCQNHAINHCETGSTVDSDGLCDIMLRLRDAGAHNINLVTPTPHIRVIAQALTKARARGLCIPVVYNTNAYEKIESLQLLDGLVDIYLPDIKYVTRAVAAKYSGAADYFEFAAKAVLEMKRQCGALVINDEGLAERGLIVRHLVLPGSVDEARRVLDFIAGTLSTQTAVSLMSQYTPCHRAEDFPPLHRRLLKREYERAVEYCINLGFENVYIQEEGCAELSFTPIFDGNTI